VPAVIELPKVGGMKSGVSVCSYSTVSRVMCSGALSCWKIHRCLTNDWEFRKRPCIGRTSRCYLLPINL